MFKQLKNKIKYISTLQRKVKLLEKENDHLKNTVVDSMELVSDFRRAAEEMNKFVNQIYRSQIKNLQKNFDQGVVDQFDEFEQEDVEEYVENNITKKKTQIH